MANPLSVLGGKPAVIKNTMFNAFNNFLLEVEDINEIVTFKDYFEYVGANLGGGAIMKNAVFSGNTNASGEVTITHEVGSAPTVNVTISGATQRLVKITAVTTTTFTVVISDVSNNPLNAQAVTFHWMARAGQSLS